MLTEGVSLIDSRSDRVVMEPNETYWNPDRRPTVRIVYDNVIGKAEGIRSVAAGDGRVDVVFDLTPDEARAFPASEHGRIQTKKAKTILTGVFNENRPDSPWRNPEARRALNRAIDRQFVLDHGAHGYGTVIPAFIQPDRYGADPDMKPFPHDRTAPGGRWRISGSAVGTSSSSPRPPGRASSRRSGNVSPRSGSAAASSAPRRSRRRISTSSSNGTSTGRRNIRWPACTASSSGVTRPCARVRRIRSSTPSTRSSCTRRRPRRRGWCARWSAYLQDEAKALFLYAPYTLFAVSDRVAFTPYDTCMSELAETRIKG